MTEKKLLFIDCDPGIDDALVLLCACAAPQVELLGVSAVAGNVGRSRTLRNALDLLSFCGREDVPVYAGADRPLRGEAVDAADIHGESGLGKAVLPRSPQSAQAEPAWEALYREAKAHPHALSLLAIGPLTDLAIAFSLHPDLPGLLKEVLIMGGGMAFGNATAAAEFNFYADPDAAQAVLRAGAPVVLFPLDVAHKAYISPQDLPALEALPSPQAKLAAQLTAENLELCRIFNGVDGSILYDLCTLAYLLEPGIFTVSPCWAGVETRGLITRGKLVADLFTDAKMEHKNCAIAWDVDRPAFVRLLGDLLSRYSK